MNFTDPNYFFNQSVLNQSLATIENGTMTAGHFQVIAEVPGVDLIVALLIVITIFQIMTFAYMLLGRNLKPQRKA